MGGPRCPLGNGGLFNSPVIANHPRHFCAVAGCTALVRSSTPESPCGSQLTRLLGAHGSTPGTTRFPMLKELQMLRTLTSSLPRALACGLILGAAVAPLRAQDDGLNFHVLSNVGDTVYFGVGAGLGSSPGVDAIGYWVGGEDLQGATLTNLTVGGVPQFGYKQSGLRLSACVFNLGPNSRLDFPAVLTAEFDDASTTDGFNYHHPYTFLRPGCGTGTANPGVEPITTNIFGAPTGTPPGASFQWIIAGLPTVLPVQGTAVLLAPNAGLVPSSNGGTLAFVQAASVTAAISAAGCYSFDLNWTAATGSSLPALDNIGGWWTQLTASRDNNQYWSISTSNLNVVKSSTGASSGGATAVFTLRATADLELQYFSLDPATNLALAPTNPYGTHPYYNTGAPGPTGNQGFDLGPHQAISNSGNTGAFAVGVPTPSTAQDTVNAFLNIGPMPTGGAVTNSIGFVTWNNNTYSTPGGSGARLTWVQLDRDLLAAGAVDPSAQTSVPVFLGAARVPVRIPGLPTTWPSALTLAFFPAFQHATTDETGNSLWPDPSGNPGGTLGVKPVVGQSLHLPVFGATGTCALGGLPLGLAYGSSGLTGVGAGPLVWDPNKNRVSFGRSILLYD
ncbi:MAG: hypothetical protein DHS20C15_25330 [Planctomycetota bacterium]|nr:MAG: hypothetical protein DHS20C15_25330 [Planctomycetota bacterium]